MNAVEPLKALARSQRGRAVAAVMGLLEDRLWPHLGSSEQAAARAAVLRAIDTYHEFVLDLLRVLEDQASEQGQVYNREMMELLRQIHDDIKRV